MNFKFVMIALMLTALPTFATQGTLSVSPAVVMLQGTPGQSTTQTLTIVNTSNQPFAFDMMAKDAVARGGHRVYVGAGELAGSIAATAVFSRKSVTVAPGERASVTVTVTIPAESVVRAILALFHGTTRMKSAGMNATASLGTLMTFALSAKRHGYGHAAVGAAADADGEPRGLTATGQHGYRAGARARRSGHRQSGRHARREAGLARAPRPARRELRHESRIRRRVSRRPLPRLCHLRSAEQQAHHVVRGVRRPMKRFAVAAAVVFLSRGSPARRTSRFASRKR